MKKNGRKWRRLHAQKAAQKDTTQIANETKAEFLENSTEKPQEDTIEDLKEFAEKLMEEFDNLEQQVDTMIEEINSVLDNPPDSEN